MLIKKIKQPTLTDTVREKILEGIKNNSMSSGDKLPSECELKKKLGVSRNIIHQAISDLRFLGILEQKRNQGTFVKEPRIFCNLATTINFPLINERTKIELHQIRLVIEQAMAPAIFSQKTEEDIDILTSIVLKEEESQDDLNILIQCDTAFHKHLYKMYGNRTMSDLMMPLKQFSCNHNEITATAPLQSINTTSHRHLLEALKGNNKEYFIEEMRRHFTA